MEENLLRRVNIALDAIRVDAEITVDRITKSELELVVAKQNNDTKRIYILYQRIDDLYDYLYGLEESCQNVFNNMKKF